MRAGVDRSDGGDRIREDGDAVATLCQPLGPSNEPTADGRGSSLKIEIWLGDLDSNQDCSGQSREFYR